MYVDILIFDIGMYAEWGLYAYVTVYGKIATQPVILWIE